MRLFSFIKKVGVLCCFTLVVACGDGDDSSKSREGETGSSNTNSTNSTNTDSTDTDVSDIADGTQVDSINLINSKAQAARFMSFASMGATEAQVEAMVGRDAASWLRDEFDKPMTLLLPEVFTFTTTHSRTGRLISPTKAIFNQH